MQEALTRTEKGAHCTITSTMRSEAVNLKNCKIDQIYILRKQKNTDREDRFVDGYVANPVYEDVVWHLFSMVRDYLAADWGGKIADGLQRGYLI